MDQRKMDFNQEEAEVNMVCFWSITADINKKSRTVIIIRLNITYYILPVEPVNNRNLVITSL